MKTRFSRIILLTAISLSALHAQILQVNSDSGEIGKYEKTEFDIRLIANWQCPYTASDVALEMHFKTPQGDKDCLPCYYVEGQSGQPSHWQARFAPIWTGIYQYQFQLFDDGICVDSTSMNELTVHASDQKGFLRPRELWTWQFDNGDVFRGIGENIGWEARTHDDSRYFSELHENPRFNYRDMLTKLAANGGNFFRTWMIYWNLPVDWKQVDNSNRYQNSASRFNESGIRRMDELVNLCDSLGIYMMLTLDSHAGFAGAGWDMNSYNIKNGGPARTAREFFTLDQAKARYKDKLRFMIARWGYSPSIATWELFNEIDNIMYQTDPSIPDSAITTWHEEMSSYLKAIDPYHHMVTTSISHREVEGLNEIATLDVNQKHMYRHTGEIPGTLRTYSAKFQKPYVIGEFSYEWDWQKNFNEMAAGMDSDFKRGLWYGLFSPTPVLPITWWWEFFDDRDMTVYFKQVQQMVNRMQLAGKGNYQQYPVQVSDPDIIALAVQCGLAGFVYLWNPGPDERHTDIYFHGLIEGPIDVFQCESGQIRPLNKKADKNILKGFSVAGMEDKILIFDMGTH